MNIYYKIILIIVLIIFFLHLKQYLKNNDENEILQSDNPNNSLLEQTLYQKLPTILTNSMEKWGNIIYWSPEYLLNNYKNLNFILIKNNFTHICKQKKEAVKFNEIVNTILSVDSTHNDKDSYAVSSTFFQDNNIDIFKITNKLMGNFMYLSNYELYFGSKTTYNFIKCENTYRNLFCQIYGTCRVLLWNPSQRDMMYPDDCYHPYVTYSKVFFNKINNDKYKKFNDSKYIEIILNPGQILYIPPYWWFYIENLNRNIRLQLRGESYFSILIKFMFEKWPAILHKLSLYKKNNCTCC